MFCWHGPFGSPAFMLPSWCHVAFLVPGLTSPVRFCVPSTVTSPISAPGSCVFAAPRSLVSTPSLLITCILPSSLLAHVWSRQVARGGGGRFSPMESEMTEAGRLLLGLFWHPSWTCGQMRALLVGRCLLLRFARL